MIRSVNQTSRFTIAATDGDIGSVTDFYFDDERWTIRYVVVDTGKWLPGREVLISPLSITRPDWNRRELVLSISRDQVRNAPGIDAHKPVSRQHEAAYFDYFGYPHYWAGGGLWGGYAVPMMTAEELARAEQRAAAEQERARRQGDTHLRSTSRVAGYGIAASDGELGHVDDFLFDDASWAIRYLVVDTSNWWFGKHVLVDPKWISGISWQSRTVTVNLSRQAIKTAPEYDTAAIVNRRWEEDFYGHLQKPGYWTDADEEHDAIRAAQDALRRDEEPTGDPLERGVRPR